MLRLKRITKQFPESCRPILNNLSITFNEGDFCIILGNNGSGKSTLLKIIAGEYQPSHGEIWVNGESISKSKAIASVVQDVNQGTVPDMTLFENIILGQLRANKPQFKFYRSRQKNVLKILHNLNPNLVNDLHTPLRCLSGGQRQLISTMMAIESNPQILLLDEHTSALDPKMQHELMMYTSEEIRRKNLLALMVTHKIEDALRYGNRLILLHEGRIVVDVAHREKKSLSHQSLLQLFNQYAFKSRGHNE